MGKESHEFVALGSRLLDVPEVLTLGVKPNFLDYTPEERQKIHDARFILYPSLNYAQYFTTMGKKIFPSVETYLYADDKIKQTTLFNMQSIPHPRTRIYFQRRFSDIDKDFCYPFIAKVPRASARGRGVYTVSNSDDLAQYLSNTKIAYIQEFLEHDRDLRVILINYQPVLAYWRYCSPEEFRTNLHQGGSIDFNDVPNEVLSMAQEYARKCKFNDVGLDLLQSKGNWYVIEANMLYGRQALKKKNMVLKEVIREKLLQGALFD